MQSETHIFSAFGIISKLSIISPPYSLRITLIDTTAAATITGRRAALLIFVVLAYFLENTRQLLTFLVRHQTSASKIFR
tara:strand:- start:613 stop:849 length:237 start_codon:yes stop_codon:yes gene_type:complete